MGVISVPKARTCPKGKSWTTSSKNGSWRNDVRVMVRVMVRVRVRVMVRVMVMVKVMVRVMVMVRGYGES